MPKPRTPPEAFPAPTDEKLKVVWKQVQTASFDDIDRTDMDRLERRLSRKSLRGEDALYGRCVLSEFFDYKGEFQKAHDVVNEEAQEIRIKLLAPGHSLSELEVAILMHYATSLYRRNNFKDADQVLDHCGRICSERGGSYAQGLSAQIAYRRGQIARLQSRFDDAYIYFTGAIEAAIMHHQASATEKGHFPATQFIGKVMIMGLGWLYFNRGQLKNARPLVLAGQFFVENSQDTLLKAFGDMILGAIERSAGGDEPAHLQRAISLLEAALKTFEGANPRYQAITEFYLGVAWLYHGDLDMAETYATAIKTHQGNDLLWVARADVALSRIARRRYEHDKNKDHLGVALQYAKLAIAEADKAGFQAVAIDGMIALAEAQLAAKDRASALKEFHLALDLSRKISDLKSSAACLLHLSRVYSDNRQLKEAHTHFTEWKQLAPFIENGALQARAEEIDRLLSDLDGDFFIPTDTENLNYNEHRDRLHRFLEQRALLKTGGDHTKAAKLMATSRQTIYKRQDPKKYARRIKSTEEE